MRRQDGQALLTVVVIMIVLQVIVWAFLAFVNFEQRLAGGSVRSFSAFYLAEAGVQRALRLAEEGSLERSSGDWPPPYTEALGSGTFTIEAVEYLPGNLISIVAMGEVGGVRRRLKVLAREGPQALGYGLYAQEIVRFGGGGRIYLLPFHVGSGGCRPAGDLAAGGQIRFDSRQVVVNTFRGLELSLREGPVTDYALLSASMAADPAGRIDLVLTGTAQLFSGIRLRPVDLDELRRDVEGLGIRRLKVRPALPAPSFDVAHYWALAESNTANAEINRAAGEVTGEAGLKSKAHSRYSVEEFEALISYLYQEQREQALRGIIFVDGEVDVSPHFRLAIADGALIVMGDILIEEGARLEVRHSQTAGALPGLVALDNGSIVIERNAFAVVDGLVLADGDVAVGPGVLDVAGAVVARNFFSEDATVVVRYDSRVLATAGVRQTGRGLVEVVSWQQLP